MRILFIHNRYQQAGGEDHVVQAETSLLARSGHTIQLWEENNDSITGLVSSAKTALQSIYSFGNAHEMRARIKDFKPDIVHIHNFFPRLSPSVHIACRRAGIPVVQTLHNFRLLCPGATFHAAERLCEECLARAVPWPAVMHGCYRHSHLASMAVANMLAIHRILGTWNRLVSQFIALSRFARDKFIAGGFDPMKIAVKPNFIDFDPGPGSGTGNFALFVGRLAEEKGVETLLTAWGTLHNRPQLKIIGDGPLADDVAQAAVTNPNIRWLGARNRQHVRRAMARATVLILPSTWYEAFPLVIAEAFATGLPIIGSKLGSIEELISNGRTGMLFTPGDAASLLRAVEWAFAHPEEIRPMRAHARAEYEQKYTAEANYTQLMRVYEAALGNSPDPVPSAPQLEAIG